MPAIAPSAEVDVDFCHGRHYGFTRWQSRCHAIKITDTRYCGRLLFLMLLKRRRADDITSRKKMAWSVADKYAGHTRRYRVAFSTDDAILLSAEPPIDAPPDNASHHNTPMPARYLCAS